MATSGGTVDRGGARRDLWVVGGAVLLAVLVTLGLSIVGGSTPGVVSSEGGSSTCAAPPGAGAAFSDFVNTEDDADVELVEVRLIGANNLELVEARAVAIPEARQDRSPFGAAHWPLSRDGQWWWDEAGRQQGPLSGWIGVMVHVSRPDPTRPGTSNALGIDYTSRGRPGTLERAHALRVAERC